MPKCPNCGQETARTGDWACQWCGYPLLSNSYKQIPKTYKQLKEEKLPKPRAPVRDEPEPEPVEELEPEPEPVAELEPEPEPVEELEPKPEPVAELEPEPEPVAELEPEPVPAAMELTVAELLSAYEMEGVAADAKFANKLLKVTGLTDRIEVKDNLGIYYINLTGAKTNLLQHVRCVFNQKHGAELNKLTPGQTVTVQGKYDGSIIDIRMKDCVIVH